MNSNDWQPHESPARTEYVVSLERKLAAAEKERDEARAQLENVLDASKDGAWMARALDAERNSALFKDRLEYAESYMTTQLRSAERERDEARAEVKRLKKHFSLEAEKLLKNHYSLEAAASLRAALASAQAHELELLRSMERGSLVVKDAEERGAKWALERHDNPFDSKTLEQYAQEICRYARNK